MHGVVYTLSMRTVAVTFNLNDIGNYFIKSSTGMFILFEVEAVVMSDSHADVK